MIELLRAIFGRKPDRKPQWDYVRTSWGGEKFYYTEAERCLFAPVELELCGPDMLRDIVNRRAA